MQFINTSCTWLALGITSLHMIGFFFAGHLGKPILLLVWLPVLGVRHHWLLRLANLNCYDLLPVVCWGTCTKVTSQPFICQTRAQDQLNFIFLGLSLVVAIILPVRLLFPLCVPVCCLLLRLKGIPWSLLIAYSHRVIASFTHCTHPGFFLTLSHSPNHLKRNVSVR